MFFKTKTIPLSLDCLFKIKTIPLSLDWATTVLLPSQWMANLARKLQCKCEDEGHREVTLPIKLQCKGFI